MRPFSLVSYIPKVALVVAALTVDSLSWAATASATMGFSRMESSSTHAAVAKYPSVNFTDTAPHMSKWVEVNGGKLNVLDWGGTGPPLVMVHGLADDPHIFDDLALRLHDRFHIVAYARRGHGLSDAVGPYDPTTLTEDLRHVLDKLGIQRASLIGWSMGGDEITDFAGSHPERIEKLVYLDSGYDWSAPEFFVPFSKILDVSGPTAVDTKSLDALRAWFRRIWLRGAPWSPGLEAYLRDLGQPDAGGTLHMKPDDKEFGALLATAGSWRRDYARVHAPALVLYATTFFTTGQSDPVLAKKLLDFERKTAGPFRQASMGRVRRELHNAIVKQIPNTTHMSIGVHDPKALAATIQEFLLAPAVRRSASEG